MVFSSYLFFFFFLPLALLVYYVLPWRLRNLALTILSYVFYGWANPKFMLIMMASTVVDYLCGLVITGQLGHSQNEGIPALPKDGTRTRLQKLMVFVSAFSNLSLLAFFKYFNFALENYNHLVGLVGLEHLGWETVFRVTLPLGISFYTFQSMSYTIDVYRGQASAIRNFTDFACYVSMFPQLVAGPIVRFHEVAGQLRTRTLSLEKSARGISLISLGLAKKVLLANPCGMIADTIFNAETAHALDAWYGVTAYAFQIYFDFSGYSDMAIGLGLLLGFVFPKNFDSPYKSKSITEFWRRWHISLSSWLHDYLYVPLGGNRRSPARTYVNLALVMLLGGLWHGAAWNFVVWGGIHGAFLAAERVRGKKSAYNRLPAPVRAALTFFIVLIAWVFFRADDLPRALTYLFNMFGLGNLQDGAGLAAAVIYQPYYLLIFLTSALVVWSRPNTWDWTRHLTWEKAVACGLLLWAALTVMLTQSFNPFIYFIF